MKPAFDHDGATHQAIAGTLRSLFPAIGGAAVTHEWGGPLGVARDWTCSVGLDREQGLAWAGGYVGDGVATTNLAGRTLADLITGRDTDLTRLLWVGHRSRRWEPEPLRWLGIRTGLRLPGRGRPRRGPHGPAGPVPGVGHRPADGRADRHARPRRARRRLSRRRRSPSRRERTGDLEGDPAAVGAPLRREVEAVAGRVEGGAGQLAQPVTDRTDDD